MTDFFKNMRIGARLALSFGGIIVLLLTMAAFNAFETSKARDMAVERSRTQAERLSLAQEWRYNIGVNAQRAIAIGMSADPTLTDLFDADMKRFSARTSEVQKRFAELETTPEGLALQQKLAAMRKRYTDLRGAMMKADASGNNTGARRLAVEFKGVVDEYIGVVSEVVDFETGRNQAIGAEVVTALNAMQDAGMATTAACVLASISLGWLLTRSIVQPLRQAQATADRIAGGDLSVDLRAVSTDEVGRLTQSLGEMQESLRRLVGGIRLSVDNIGVASSEVAAGNHDLSARTEQSAASLQQTASSIEQISSTVRQSADSARQADQLAQRASEVATEGGEAVGGVVRTMERIQESSKKIAEIIGTIDSIAFQTNILALNAAVEAARAGEQGRGFAVVATEVRTLAQRSSTAAREIKALIGESVDRVESGWKQAQAAGTTLTDLVASVRRVSDIVGDISSATTEQAQGIGEINQAVGKLDEATQQNAALVEESAAAATSLKEQASMLAQSVQRFRLAA